MFDLCVHIPLLHAYVAGLSDCVNTFKYVWIFTKRAGM